MTEQSLIEKLEHVKFLLECGEHVSPRPFVDECISIVRQNIEAMGDLAPRALKPEKRPAEFPANTKNRINKIISGCMTRGMSSEATTDEVWEYLYLNKTEKWYSPDDASYENTMLRGKLVETNAVIETIKSFAYPMREINGVCGAIVEFIEGNTK